MTKALASRARLATLELYASFRCSAEIGHATTPLDKSENSVVKPAKGSGGSGILVIGPVG